MDRMLVVVFDTESKAYEGKKALYQLAAEGHIVAYAHAVVAKNADGSATVRQRSHQWPIATLAGTFLGGLAGLLVGMTGLAIGATLGLLGGIFMDINNARIGEDFIDDVTEPLLPGTFVVIAEVQESWTAPVDLRMEALGGKVFRRAMSVDEHTVDEQEAAALMNDLAQLMAEQAKAHADRRAKILARLERAKERREAAQCDALGKTEMLRTNAAALMTRGAEVDLYNRSHELSV